MIPAIQKYDRFYEACINQTAIANNKIINLNQTKYPDTQINGMLIIV